MSDDVDERTDEEQDNDEDSGIITLVDESGEETDWGFLGTVEEGDAIYALLAPIEQLDDEESDTLEVALFRYTTTDDGGESFAEIEDDEERERIEALATAFLEAEGLVTG